MEVGQVVLPGPWSNLTMFSLVLENLPYGDAASLQEAEGNSIVLSNRLWPIRYKRSEPRLVLHDVVLVIPEQSQIDGVIYWVNAFNSELEFWRNRTTFLRDTMKYTVIKYTLGSVPGDYVIITAFSKDQLVWNVTYTTRPQVAAPLPLNFNASLHSRGSSNLDPQIGAVRDVQDLVLALWNQRSSACSRSHILLPAQQQLSLAPANLSLTQQQVQPAAGSNAGSSGSNGGRPGSSAGLSVIPVPLAEAGLQAGDDGDSVAVLLPNGTEATWNGSVAKSTTPSVWPPPGGEPIDCPATIRGLTGMQEQTVVDVAFSRGLFAVSGPTRPNTDASTVGAAATADAAVLLSGGVLHLEELQLVNLPQGEGASAFASNSSSLEAVMPTAPGLWISLVPRRVYTHLLWFIDRNLFSPNGPSVTLSNVTLLLPPQEAAQLAAMAAVAAVGVAPGLVQFQLSFPSRTGPLPMVYRNVSLGKPVPAADAADGAAAAPSGSGRRLLAASPCAHNIWQAGCSRGCPGPRFDLRRKLLQAAAAAPAAPPSSRAASTSRDGVICVGQMEGAGLVGKNVCMVPAAGPEYQLPPGYFWPQGSGDGASASSGSKGWPAWQVAVVASVLGAAVLAALLLAALLLLRRKRKQTVAQALKAEAKSLVGVAHTKNVGSSQNASSTSSRRIAAVSNGGGNSSTGTSSSQFDSGTFARLQALARLYDCCPGQGTLSPPGSSNAAGAAFTTAAGAEAAALGRASRGVGVHPTEGAAGGEPYSNLPTLRRSTDSAGSGPVVVSLGDQLGQLAAVHMASLDFGSGEHSGDSSRPTLGFGSFTISGGGRMQQQQQQAVPFTGLSVGMPLALGGRLPPQAATPADSMAPAGSQGAYVANDDAHGTFLMSPAQHQQLRQQLQQQAAAQLQSQQRQQGASRISSAISTVTADLQLQRINRYANSTVSNASGPSHSPRASVPDEVYVSVQDSLSRVSAQRQRRSSFLQQRQSEIEPVSEQESGTNNQQIAMSARHSPSGQLRQDLLRSQSQASTRRGALGSGGSGSGVMTGTGQLHLMEVIGAGSFGVVYRASWRGIPAAVKVMQLPVFEDEAPLGAAHARSPTGGAGLAAAAVAERRRRGGINRREQMAVMEAALGSSLSHPNILQVYTYLLRPLTAPGRVQGGNDPVTTQQQLQHQLDDTSTSTTDQQAQLQLARQSRGMTASRQGSGDDAVVTGYELQLVMEYCPLGSLRAAIDNGLLEDRLTRRPDYLTVLTLALGVAHAMNHLHSEGIVHGDLKAGNVLLKAELRPVAFDAAEGGGVASLASTAGVGLQSTAAGTSGPSCSNVAGVSSSGGSRAIVSGRVRHQEQLVAKVADFGLACRLRDHDTHVSGVHRGTLNHMAPELLLHGHASRASDVYAFGILMWEMATGMRAFSNVPKALVAAVVLRDQARPEWPDSSSMINLVVSAAAAAAGATAHEGMPPMAYRELAAACWAHEARDRPSFDLICTTLGDLLAQEHARQAKLSALVQQQPTTVTPPELAAARQQQQQQQQQQQGIGGPAAATPRPPLPPAGAAAAAAASDLAPANSSFDGPAAAAGPGRSGAVGGQPFSPFAAAEAEPFASRSVASLAPLGVGSRKGTAVSSQDS